ncbi:hypothetical protein CE195_06665 [Sodalis-like symbiont of Philaenus spumarius]|nr:hypothetical protein CE195_06665 [Sodalis-like symbiont of Philaenus spumarius]
MKFIDMALSPTKRERFRCQCCRRVFQLTYRYEARKPGIKEQIVDMAFNRKRVSGKNMAFHLCHTCRRCRFRGSLQR